LRGTAAGESVDHRAPRHLNQFVGVVQTFQKVPFFKALAPTQTEPSFAIAQLLVLALLVVLGIAAAVKRFHPAAVHVPAYR
jgi:hypothetical protein